MDDSLALTIRSAAHAGKQVSILHGPATVSRDERSLSRIRAPEMRFARTKRATMDPGSLGARPTSE